MKKLLATLPLLALLSCTGIPPQHALSHFDWTEPADPQGEKPETWKESKNRSSRSARRMSAIPARHPAQQP